MREPIGILGAGVIGASWTALFCAGGHPVRVFDPVDGAEAFVRRYVADAWPVLQDLGLTGADAPPQFDFVQNAKDAVKDAVFIQENVPERLPVKHALYQEIEPHLRQDAVIATSASGLMLSELQEAWDDPAPLILGHPFNPPHLIPLVEVMGNDHTRPGAVEVAEALYAANGKVTIRVQKEVPGHVANRLQAALWREAINLARDGVASVGDIDKAIWSGPGLRWAAGGPTTLWHMAAGPGGIAEYCARYGPSFDRWWADMKDARMTPEVIRMLADGVAEATDGRDLESLATARDDLITAMLRATAGKPRI
ncbi:3-hydroxyacyl-CoA dehydrogenase NAD-binding domain-containing protein [Pseudaestuariivita atlantica]|uniref:3-hydroxyacyl-CoA dehydrogenase n=1 Tax=Pseudaestuariivita atlantica TaxID=1317121 RepID=A0A0L1JU07_9RHOB|nr:3-hydroxyacyl-CoA dehydrogenase NAD-binding domain-containing protein [Pseudaestuariivita atlantica]KNG95259.1 3-hydroxyacyl-CoA dehydrogenase [Pseudaestuariivita atlantica]